jgi:hypothetical protein
MIAVCGVPVAAAERPVEVRVEVGDRSEVAEVGRILDLDEKTRGLVLYGWGTAKEFEAVERLGYLVEVVPPGPTDLRALNMCAEPFDPPYPWDCYPTWAQFEEMMAYYAATYPAITELVNLGMSGEGDHELWALKISDNPGAEENEPEVLYTGTMHGDELVCYGTTVHLIDDILSSYGTDDLVTRLVNETVLWINPLSNPDGTFDGGDSTVSGASRGLPASGYADPNRSFPDPSVPEDPGAPGWPAEVQVLMDLAEAEHFTIAANCHSGAEVFNYPWDVWSERHVDDDWWIDAGTTYASSAQALSPGGYFTMCPGSCPYPGVTNGYDWYTTSGNRQDFMNWYHGCREVTLELADAKALDGSDLPDYYDWNRDALLTYFDLALTGVRGVVTDAVTGDPVAAEIRVTGHDLEHQRSFVTTDPDVGDYHRLIDPGTYDLEVTAAGFEPITINGVIVPTPDPGQGVFASVMDVNMTPLPRYTVTGLVTDGVTGLPVQGAAVTLVGTTVAPVATGSTGSYSILDIWEDTYTFRVDAPDYGVVQDDLFVGPGSTTHDFVLTPLLTLVAEDFEGDDGGMVTSDGWEWGSDGTAGAHSGVNVWGTALDGPYDDDAMWSLDSPLVDLAGADGAELRFWQWYEIEGGWDGARIEISVDGGTFALASPTPDYNDQTIDAFDDTPGYTGTSPWHEVVVDLTPHIGHSVVVRWTLGTDGSQTRQGWYIDDVSFTAWGGDLVNLLFADGFESGETGRWSAVLP